MTEMNTPETTSEADKKAVSDARIILGPLVKYALMGFVIVSIIITTGIMLDRQFNDIDRELALLESELAAAYPATVTNTETAEKIKTTDVVVTNADLRATVTTDLAENTETETPAVAETAVVDTAVKAETISVIENTNIDPFDQSIEAVIAKRNAYLKEMDRIYLEEYKARQENQLQFMRQRLAGQKQRIRDIETRYQQRYDARAGEVMERQEQRESFLTDRI